MVWKVIYIAVFCSLFLLTVAFGFSWLHQGEEGIHDLRNIVEEGFPKLIPIVVGFGFFIPLVACVVEWIFAQLLNLFFKEKKPWIHPSLSLRPTPSRAPNQEIFLIAFFVAAITQGRLLHSILLLKTPITPTTYLLGATALSLWAGIVLWERVVFKQKFQPEPQATTG